MIDPTSTVEELVGNIRSLARDRGQVSDDVVDRITPELSDLFDQAGSALAEGVAACTAKVKTEVDQRLFDFRAQLARDWGPMLGLMLTTIEYAEQLANGVSERGGDPRDTQTDVLLGLAASALRTAREAHCLLTDGFPFGALARARTIHELAVVAAVLGRFGREPANLDLAERFAAHRLVTQVAEAETSQNRRIALGDEPLSDELLSTLRAQRDGLIRRWGKQYGQNYGWAAALNGGRAPKLRTLEELADMSSMREHYIYSSHFVRRLKRRSTEPTGTRRSGHTLNRQPESRPRCTGSCDAD